jgi:hypothetical protein
MFEHTPLDTAKRLEGLDASAISFLTDLPTFLCSEISITSNQPSMLIRFGKIESINPGPIEVEFEFGASIDFGEVSFQSLDDARELFDAGRLQLYRTHWAVHEGASREVLDKLFRKYPRAQRDGDAHALAIRDTPAPPPRSKKILGRTEGVKEFLELLFQTSKEKQSQIFYRGHNKQSYELVPSLLRRWKDGNWKYLPNEDRLCKELLIAHYDDFQGDEYCFDRLARMQHYGLPTRLLDVTENPLIALYFACEKDPSEDGEVIILEMEPERVKYYDSDTVSCISNLSNLSFDTKGRMDFTLDLSDFNKSEVIKRLHHHIRAEKGYFEERIKPEDLSSIVCVKAKRNNLRVKSQLGAFLLFGHEAVLPDRGNADIKVSRITVSDKIGTLDELDRLNINASSIYPGIEKSAEQLKVSLLCSGRDS